MPEYLGPHAERGTETTTYTEPMRAAAKAATLDVPADAKIVAVPEQATAVTATEWAPLAIALTRGAIEGVVLSGAAVGALLYGDGDIGARVIWAVILTVFFGRLAIALGVGQIDQFNARR